MMRFHRQPTRDVDRFENGLERDSVSTPTFDRSLNKTFKWKFVQVV